MLKIVSHLPVGLPPVAVRLGRLRSLVENVENILDSTRRRLPLLSNKEIQNTL